VLSVLRDTVIYILPATLVYVTALLYCNCAMSKCISYHTLRGHVARTPVCRFRSTDNHHTQLFTVHNIPGFYIAPACCGWGITSALEELISKTLQAYAWPRHWQYCYTELYGLNRSKYRRGEMRNHIRHIHLNCRQSGQRVETSTNKLPRPPRRSETESPSCFRVDLIALLSMMSELQHWRGR